MKCYYFFMVINNLIITINPFYLPDRGPLSQSSPDVVRQIVKDEREKYLDKYKQSDMSTVFGNHASDIMQSRLNNVINAYQDKGLIKSDEQFSAYIFNDAGLAYLREMSYSTKMNAISHNKNIWVTPDHEMMSQEESESQLAHEVAHYVIFNNRIINPKQCWYMLDDMNDTVKSGIVTAAMMWTGFKGKAPGYIYRRGILIGTLGLFFLPMLNMNKESWEVPNFVQKAEEIQCDIIAAKVKKNGFKDGASFCQRAIDNSIENRTSKDHPTLKTRIFLHKTGNYLDKFFNEITRKRKNI